MESLEQTPKCRLGKSCYEAHRCNVHQWTWQHNEAWGAIRISGVITFCGIALLMGILAALPDYAQIESNIEGFNCKQLAEYIADKSTRYTYAEHRYEWLCVNEQVKEFQG